MVTAFTLCPVLVAAMSEGSSLSDVRIAKLEQLGAYLDSSESVWVVVGGCFMAVLLIGGTIAQYRYEHRKRRIGEQVTIRELQLPSSMRTHYAATRSALDARLLALEAALYRVRMLKRGLIQTLESGDLKKLQQRIAEAERTLKSKDLGK